MRISLEYTAVLDIKTARSGSDVDVPPGLTISGLLSHLGIRREHHKYIVASTNGVKSPHTAELRDGDRVVLSLPLGGG